MKPRTITEVVTKALARSGPELRPEQIRLDDEAQTDKKNVYTQRDVNLGMSGGGGPGPAPEPIDLDGYATTEQLTEEAHARETGDKANQAAITEANKAIQELAKDLDAVENDYTTTEDFNHLNSKVTQNKKDIASLGEAFDTAVLAAQDGAEALEIELQSYAKKDDTYTKAEVDQKIPEIPEMPEIPDQVTYLLQTDKVLRSGEPAIELVDSDGNFSNVKVTGANGISVTSDMAALTVDGTALNGRIETLQGRVTALEEAEPPSAGIDWADLPVLSV